MYKIINSFYVIFAQKLARGYHKHRFPLFFLHRLSPISGKTRWVKHSLGISYWFLDILVAISFHLYNIIEEYKTNTIHELVSLNLPTNSSNLTWQRISSYQLIPRLKYQFITQRKHAATISNLIEALNPPSYNNRAYCIVIQS